MPSQIALQQLLDIFILIQQAFIFRISKSTVSISFNIEEKTLALRVYVFETISDNEQSLLVEVNNDLKEKTTNKISFEIIKIKNKANLLDLNTFKYKLYLKNIC